jgi:hypothetical protein
VRVISFYRPHWTPAKRSSAAPAPPPWTPARYGPPERDRSRPFVPLPEPARNGPMGTGELYEYYKRLGRLDLFFALFPHLS